MRRFVLIRLYRLGDLLMATALARAWKEEAPTHLTWIVGERFAPLLRGQPYVDRLILIPDRFITRYARSSSWEDRSGPLEEAQRLFPRVFEALPPEADRVVNLQYSTSGLLLAGRIRTQDRAGPYLDAEGFQRVDDLWSQYYLAMGAEVRYAVVHWTDAFLNIGRASRRGARTEYRPRPCPAFQRRFDAARAGHPYFVVQLGAYEEDKRWPPERYQEAAEQIARATGWIPVLVGSRTERVEALRTAQALTQRGVPVLCLAGATDFDQLAYVLRGAQVVLGNDTFTQHFAAALERPVVTVFQGRPSPWLTLAYQEGSIAVANDDGSPPEVERVVGAVLGSHRNFWVAQRIGDYQFCLPAGPEAQTDGWKARWIIGTGHLRALDPAFSAGPEVRVTFPRAWLEEIEQLIAQLEAGKVKLPPKLDARLYATHRNHPLAAFLIVAILKNHFSALRADAVGEYRNNYLWLREALLRAGVPE
ncbi:MAG: hypothetical protein KatS3mg115_0791 [Candidatus Poribacteria bacterium]|nr:MAG: hypothetical protein KatS3mg115_0791 [Candidatus Poribacteria bacterium]